MIAASLILAGCAEDAPSPAAATPSPAPSPAPTPGEAGVPALLLLTRADDTATLSLVRLSGGIDGLPLPDPSTAATVTLPGGDLVAVLDDGRAFVTPGVSALLAGAGWRPLDGTGGAALPPGTIIFAAAASPDGKRLASIARPPLAEAPSALVLSDLEHGRRTIHPLPDESTGPPPAWIDDNRVAIVQRDRFGRTFVAIVAAVGGEIGDRISLRALDFRTSGDARMAVVLGDDSRLFVGSTADILERRAAPDEGPALRPGDVVRGGVALDSDGRRLAAVVEDVAGVNQIATFVRVGETWQAGARMAAPSGSTGGWVSWLP